MNSTELIGWTSQGWPVYFDMEPDLYHIREDAERVNKTNKNNIGETHHGRRTKPRIQQ